MTRPENFLDQRFPLRPCRTAALRRPSNRVGLRRQVKQIELIRCSTALAAVLGASA